MITLIVLNKYLMQNLFHPPGEASEKILMEDNWMVLRNFFRGLGEMIVYVSKTCSRRSGSSLAPTPERFRLVKTKILIIFQNGLQPCSPEKKNSQHQTTRLLKFERESTNEKIIFGFKISDISINFDSI